MTYEHDLREQARRRAATEHKHELHTLALAAFDRLCAPLGLQGVEEARRQGLALLLAKGPLPLVELRCQGQRHKLAGVWRTPDGALFVAAPAVSQRREWREGSAHVRDHLAPRHHLSVDLLDLLPQDDRHPRLRCSCRCGLRDLTSFERDALRAEVLVAKRTAHKRQFLLEHPIR